jgi:hypothetical protein
MCRPLSPNRNVTIANKFLPRGDNLCGRIEVADWLADYVTALYVAEYNYIYTVKASSTIQ